MGTKVARRGFRWRCSACGALTLSGKSKPRRCARCGIGHGLVREREPGRKPWEVVR